MKTVKVERTRKLIESIGEQLETVLNSSGKLLSAENTYYALMRISNRLTTLLGVGEDIMTGAELKALRQSTGLSQVRFAVMVLGANAAQPVVCQWESGRRTINALKATGIRVKVARYLSLMAEIKPD